MKNFSNNSLSFNFSFNGIKKIIYIDSPHNVIVKEAYYWTINFSKNEKTYKIERLKGK